MIKKFKIFLSVFLCGCMLLCGSFRPFFAYASLDDEEYDEYTEEDIDEGSGTEEETETASSSDQYQDQISAINAKLGKLAEERKRIQADINGAKDEKAKKQAERGAIDRQIAITKEEIEGLAERIAALEVSIAQKEREIESKLEDIAGKQDEIDDNYEILRKRLRAMYMQDNTTTLGLPVGADSFSDLLTNTEYVRRIAEHDRALLAELTGQRLAMEDEKASLEQKKTELEADKTSVEADKAETEDKKSELDVQYSKANLQVQNLEQMEREYLADLENNRKAEDAAKAALDQIYREIEWSKNPYIGGEMAWPVPGLYTFSSEYGLRFGGADNHTGIDITGSGAYGKPVVAANAGTVVKANWSYTPGVGYGIFVLLDHGGNVSTLYGHLSNIVVKEGDVVSKSQKIGEVGSTGWSTGPHLHFEVRINGKHVPPKPYIVGAQ